MDSSLEFTGINGKRVGCIIDFSEYTEAHYKKDFAEFVDYQVNKRVSGPEDTDLKFYNLKSYPYIPFDLFKQYCIKFFSKSLFFLLGQYPQFIVSEELVIWIKMKRVPNRSYYFDSDDNGSGENDAIYTGAGIWFIQTIAAPFHYFRKIDYSLIARYFAHELTHYYDNMRGNLLFEKKYERRIKVFSKKKSAYCLNYLYNSRFNLREEGFAEFNTRINSPSIDINMEGVKQYNKNMEDLCELRLKEQAENFYIKRIGWENLTPSGEYSNGKYMCLTIALFVAKMKNKGYTIKANNRIFFGNAENLNKILSSSKVVYISDLPQDVFQESIKLIGQTAQYYFLKLYEKACDALGISEQNRIMTSNRFRLLCEKAIETAKRERKERLRRRGFDSRIVE